MLFHMISPLWHVEEPLTLNPPKKKHTCSIFEFITSFSCIVQRLSIEARPKDTTSAPKTTGATSANRGKVSRHDLNGLLLGGTNWHQPSAKIPGKLITTNTEIHVWGIFAEKFGWFLWVNYIGYIYIYIYIHIIYHRMIQRLPKQKVPRSRVVPFTNLFRVCHFDTPCCPKRC